MKLLYWKPKANILLSFGQFFMQNASVLLSLLDATASSMGLRALPLD